MKLIRIISISILIGILLPACGFSKWLFRSSGTYQVAIAEEKAKYTLVVGKIVSRDSRYSPFLIDNFKDMLQLQLMDTGYIVKEIPQGKTLRKILDSSQKSQEKPSKIDPAGGSTSSKEQKATNDDSAANLKELLPENLRNNLEKNGVIGFSNSVEEKYNDDFLTSEEVKFLSEKYNFQFFIQGAVGNNSSGTLLDEDANSLVFLKVYDSKGDLKGAMTYTVNGRSLSEAPLLKDVCGKISLQISKIFNKSN